MKINLKTVKNVNFQVEVPDSAKVRPSRGALL